ncbi:mediator of RNA polymerase II transcription subunit 13-like [Trifolium pratense]|uniref:mediator of RNA polymerase II transcription subunit 13-like n=1 Tax=Trifolium pratense TaxID=57577 RepID=UPI001E692956|nr:mediator of RNA polymerase II transcription subunit 13-like [Trifolium pratense]
MSDFGSMEVNNSVITSFDEPIGSYWDWAPGTAESQALVLSAPDCGDFNSSPVGANVMDVSDQILLPVGFSSFESFNPTPPAVMEEYLNKDQDNLNNSMSMDPTNQTQMLYTGEFDHIIKAEAIMTFAPEFGAVEAPTSGLSTALFRSPYFPSSRKAESSNFCSNNYLYGAEPPSSPYIEGSDGKNGLVINTTCSGKHDTSMTPLKKLLYFCGE